MVKNWRGSGFINISFYLFFFVTCKCRYVKEKNRIFQLFCINRFGISLLHNVLSRSDFGFEFVEIFVIEKRLPALVSRGVDKIALNKFSSFKTLNNLIGIVYYILSLVLYRHCSAFLSSEKRCFFSNSDFPDSPMWGVGDSPSPMRGVGDPPTHRVWIFPQIRS
jgi:hypothetical protein